MPILSDNQSRQSGSFSGRLLAPFRRVTSSGSFISEIDGLRFIAIGSVVLFHLVVNLGFKSPAAYTVPSSGNLLAAVARHGFRGVELFFIISGFILAYPFASHWLLGRPRVHLGQYFLRRLTRLEPPYMLCMVFLFLVRVADGSGTSWQLLPHLGASLVYSHNLLFQSENPINNVAWSLEIEVQFYLLVPILSRIFMLRSKITRRSIIVAAIGASALTEWLFIGPESPMYLTIIRFLHFFLIGFLLADLYLLNWHGRAQKSLRWDLVSLLGWPALFVLWNSPWLSKTLFPHGHLPVLGALLFPPLAFFLYQAVFRGVITNRIMTNLWITTIGGMCYTIYLFHNPLIGALASLTRSFVPTGIYTLNVIVQGCILLPIVVGACALYFVTIERPCMRRDWPRKLVEKTRSLFDRPAAEGLKDPMSDSV
ncbi:MAG TPA: acyltransferase [Bacteroidota bacterium]|nr:acyltransferase [Bacteroidota bacterium]